MFCAHFSIYRGTQDKNAVDAAFQTLGPSKVVPPHILQGQTRTQTYNANNHTGVENAMDYNDAAGASGAVQTYHMNGPDGAGPDGGTHRTQQTFYDGDTTRQVTTETSQQQFGSTTVTKVRREEVISEGGYPSPSTAHKQVHIQQNNVSTPYPQGGAGGSGVPTFSVTRFESSTQPQQKPGVWAPSGTGGGGLSVSAPEGVHVHKNSDQSVTMTVGLGSPRQHGTPSPRQRDASPSQYDQGKHVPQFSVSKVGGNRPDMWVPGGGGDAPVLKPFTVPAPKWSPTTSRKPTPPEVAPKPQLPPQYEPQRPPNDDLDAVPDGPPPRPHWSHLDPSARDSPITRIPENPPQIEPMHFSELIRGESFSDDDDYLDSPTTALRKSMYFPRFQCDFVHFDNNQIMG